MAGGAQQPPDKAPHITVVTVAEWAGGGRQRPVPRSCLKT
ncbi:MAG: hypothetical protein JWM17_3118, partial [Actinobacteria bacterium]|nr:hypothetical protein [Actinomycetota bacterium]